MIKDFLIALGNYKKYKTLAKNSGWKVAGYLALLLIICSIGGAIIPTINIANALGEFFAQEISDFTISNEGFEIAEDFGFELAGIKILATSSKEVTEEDFGDNVSGFLLDKNSIIIRNMGETAEFSYNEFNTGNEIFKFSKKDLNLLKPFMTLFKGMLAVAMAFSFITSYLINGLFIGLISTVIAFWLKVRKTPGELIKLSLYSKTLPAVLSAVLTPFGFFILPLISSIYALVIMVLYLRFERKNDNRDEII